MTEFQKLENMLDKSLNIFFNRMEKKIEDSIAPVQDQIDDLASNFDKQLQPLRSEMEDLSFSQQAEIQTGCHLKVNQNKK